MLMCILFEAGGGERECKKKCMYCCEIADNYGLWMAPIFQSKWKRSTFSRLLVGTLFSSCSRTGAIFPSWSSYRKV